MDLGLVALISAVALLGPALTLLTRGVIPVVIGELVAGVILGKTGFGTIDPGKSDLQLLYDLGFATLMFTVGMNVPLHDPRVRGALKSGAVAVAIAVPLALAGGFAAHLAGHGPALVYAVVLVSSSAAVALPVIDDAGLSSPPVLTAIAWITLADVISTIAIPLVIKPSRAPHAALGVVIVMAVIGAVFAVVRLVHQQPLVHRVRKEGKKRAWAIDLRLAVVALFSIAFLAQKVGASILVAGFGIGLVVAALGGPKRLSQEVLGLGQGFFVPLFFVLLGSEIDVRALTSSGRTVLLAVLLAVLATAVHVATSVAIRAPRAIGLLATAQLGVPAAVIALGLPLGAITQGEASAIFCGALASIGVTTAGSAILRRGAASRASSPSATTVPEVPQPAPR